MPTLPLLAAATVFVATDIDDLLLLTAFFADPGMRPRAVVVGQFAGIAVLVAACALAAVLALAVPPAWVALLGIVPLGMGLWQLAGLLRGLDDEDDDDAESLEREHALEGRGRAQWIAVALVTVANGGDNLGVYIPLFARDPAAIPIYAAVFAAGTAGWCALGHWLVRHRRVGVLLRRHGHRLVPWVLVAVGLHVLWGARVLLAAWG